jgi:hypothetical protein
VRCFFIALLLSWWPLTAKPVENPLAGATPAEGVVVACKTLSTVITAQKEIMEGKQPKTIPAMDFETGTMFGYCMGMLQANRLQRIKMGCPIPVDVDDGELGGIVAARIELIMEGEDGNADALTVLATLKTPMWVEIAILAEFPCGET